MKHERRKRSLVDRDIQLGLACRLLMYWCATWLVVFAIPIVTQLFFTAISFNALAIKLVGDLWFPMTMSIFLLPIVARDCIRFSNRVAGPIYRFKKTVRDMADGRSVDPIKLRKDDFCHDLANEINILAEKQAEHALSIADPAESNLRISAEQTAAS